GTVGKEARRDRGIERGEGGLHAVRAEARDAGAGDLDDVAGGDRHVHHRGHARPAVTVADRVVVEVADQEVPPGVADHYRAAEVGGGREHVGDQGTARPATGG